MSLMSLLIEILTLNKLNTLHWDKKKVTRLLRKCVFKVATIADIPTDTEIFNSCFIDKINDAVTDKIYDKSWLVIQAENN